MRKLPLRRIAIVYSASSASWIVPILGGIRRYANTQDGWHLSSSASMLLGAGGSALTLRSLGAWKCDAVITASNEESELRAIQALGVPAVNLSPHLAKSFGVPRVLVDDFQAGRLAADHLLSRGLRHLAFLGSKGVWYSEQRRLGFSERATEARVDCEVHLQPAFESSKQSWHERLSVMGKWAASLPRPSGVFAVHDFRAQLFMEACMEAGLGIPDDLAIMGMNNDGAICEHSVPTLTSISRNPGQVGWEAAALLDRMMQEEPAPAEDLIIAPDGVVLRQSTDLLQCGDAVIQGAVDYMRGRLGVQFNIEQLAEHLGVSKRTIETRFRENFQSSPYEFLTRLRVEHAQALMKMPKKRTLGQTANECGFGTTRALREAFERVTGGSLVTFRRKQRAENAIAPA